ncbi:glycoprotein 60 [Cryptosporidium xiaoi]|uniref:Glycoprotein 60 n=1 Tax=Cryptosporidium xiaoi TaxID=659607 RepID=A0AAV9Y305_9CRYT
MRLVLYVTLLSALIALVLSAPSVPLRGSLSSSQLGNSRSSSSTTAVNGHSSVQPRDAPAESVVDGSGESEESKEGKEKAEEEGHVTTENGNSDSVQSDSGNEEDAQTSSTGTVPSTQQGGGEDTEVSDSTSETASSTTPPTSSESTTGGEQTSAPSAGTSGTDDHEHGATGDNGTVGSGSTTDHTGSGTGSTEGGDATDSDAQDGTTTGSGSHGSSTNGGGNGNGQGSGSGGAGAGAGNDGSGTTPVICGEKFVVWFSDGIPVTTVSCGEYTGIYYPSANGNPGPKYISGGVTSVEVEDGKIKVNGEELSSIPVKPGDAASSGPEVAASGAAGKSAKSRSRRSLQEEVVTTEVADVYSFTAGGKSFTVKLPKEEEASKRNKYILADDGGDVIFEGTKKEEFHFDNEGDLLDSQNNVILQSDESTSSAFDLKYIIPSISAFVLSILLF